MSFFDDASLVFLPSGGAGKDGKAYSIKPVPEYGNELVTNGGFDTDSDWSKGTGWSIGSGVATANNVPNLQRLQQGVGTSVIGKTYKYSLSVSNVSGFYSVYIFGVYVLATVNTEGTFEGYVTATSTNGAFWVAGASASGLTAATIDNVSVKEVIVEDGDFTFSRGSNLTATRVDSNGLIEKGRENLLINSVWDGVTTDTKPTGWTFQLVSGTGTFDVTATEGQIRFQTLDASSRAFIYSPTITTNGIVVASVYVDEVTTAMPLSDLLTRTANATALFAYEDGVQINYYSDNVQAGKRYSVVFNKTASTNFRFGVGVSSGTLGDVVLSRPQIEVGLVATEWITSPVGSTGLAGILEDSPRFDYSGGASCPSLLLEPSRTNLVEYSEYTGSDYWNKTGLDHTDNATISPEGVQNASLVTETIDNSQHLINIYYQNRPNVAAGSVTHSVRVKDNGIGTIILYNNGSSGGASAIFDISAGTKGAIGGSATSSDIKPLGNGWYEIYMTFTALAGNSSIAIYMRTQATYSGDGTSGIYIYGAQMEEGSYPTSYIPNHSGGSVTRGEETTSYLTLPETLTDDFTLFFDFKEINTVNGWIAFTDSSNVAVYTFYSYSGHFDVNNGSAYILESSADPNGKIALKQSGSSVKVFVNGVDKTKSGATANLTDIAKFRFASRDSRNSATLNQILVFPEALSNTDCEILTGTSYESFAAMATALNYTTYE